MARQFISFPITTIWAPAVHVGSQSSTRPDRRGKPKPSQCATPAPARPPTPTPANRQPHAKTWQGATTDPHPHDQPLAALPGPMDLWRYTLPQTHPPQHFITRAKISRGHPWAPQARPRCTRWIGGRAVDGTCCCIYGCRFGTGCIGGGWASSKLEEDLIAQISKLEEDPPWWWLRLFCSESCGLRP